MQLGEVEVSWVDLSLRAEVRTSGGVHRRRPVVVVKVTGDGVEGWGECGALPEGTPVDPPLARVWEVLVEQGVPRLVALARDRDGENVGPGDAAAACGPGASERMAGAALEMAVLDAELRSAGVSLAMHLGMGRAGVPFGGVVGIPADRSVDVLLTEVSRLVATEAHRVRLKIAPGWDLVPVAAVRRHFPDLQLQVDANGAYRLGADDGTGAERLETLDPYGLVCIEQPMDPSDIPAHALLAERLETPIGLDESLATPGDLERALAAGACEVACLKPSRLGGITAFQEARRKCVAAAVPAFVGGFFETGLARSVNACLAGLDGLTLPGDISDPSGYLEIDPAAWPPSRGPDVEVWQGAGVGPPFAPALIAPRTRRVQRFTVSS